MWSRCFLVIAIIGVAGRPVLGQTSANGPANTRLDQPISTGENLPSPLGLAKSRAQQFRRRLVDRPGREAEVGAVSRREVEDAAHGLL